MYHTYKTKYYLAHSRRAYVCQKYCDFITCYGISQNSLSPLSLLPLDCISSGADSRGAVRHASVRSSTLKEWWCRCFCPFPVSCFWLYFGNILKPFLAFKRLRSLTLTKCVFLETVLESGAEIFSLNVTTNIQCQTQFHNSCL